MIIQIVSSIAVLLSISVFVYTWKTNVEPPKKNNENHEVRFYDDVGDEEENKSSPWYSSKIDNLDYSVSGAVRYNQSMYYDSDKFEELKAEVLSYKFPK